MLEENILKNVTVFFSFFLFFHPYSGSQWGPKQHWTPLTFIEWTKYIILSSREVHHTAF